MRVKVFLSGSGTRQIKNLVHEVPDPVSRWGREFDFGEHEDKAWTFAHIKRLEGYMVELKVSLYKEAELLHRYLGVETEDWPEVRIKKSPINEEAATMLLGERRLLVTPSGFRGCSSRYSVYDEDGKLCWSAPHCKRNYPQTVGCELCGRFVVVNAAEGPEAEWASPFRVHLKRIASMFS